MASSTVKFALVANRRHFATTAFSASSRLLPQNVDVNAPLSLLSGSDFRPPSVASRFDKAAFKYSLQFSNNKSLASKHDKEEEKRPSREDLERVRSVLSHDIPRFFIKTPNFSIYGQNFECDDRINGKTYKIVDYIKQVYYIRIWGNLRYTFIRTNVVSENVIEAESAIEFRFRVRALPFFKMMIYMFPKKLYISENMNKNADIIAELISTYYVGKDGKVFLHVIDDKQTDRDREPSKVNLIQEKLNKLRKSPPVPAPSL